MGRQAPQMVIVTFYTIRYYLPEQREQLQGYRHGSPKIEYSRIFPATILVPIKEETIWI